MRLTGVASRYIWPMDWRNTDYFRLAFPVVGAVLQNIPKPVLGGATLVMFGTVAAAG
ncbi:solute carrier family 23 protein (plasmid) [Pseudoalteromonas espejiana]